MSKREWTARPVVYDGEPNGEWEVVIHDPGKTSLDEPWYVAAIKVFDSCDDLDTEQTARLIAAAPRLSEALKHLTMMARTSGGIAGPDPDLMAACDEAEAALSRASGLPDGEPS